MKKEGIIALIVLGVVALLIFVCSFSTMGVTGMIVSEEENQVILFFLLCLAVIFFIVSVVALILKIISDKKEKMIKRYY